MWGGTDWHASETHRSPLLPCFKVDSDVSVSRAFLFPPSVEVRIEQSIVVQAAGFEQKPHGFDLLLQVLQLRLLP